ncbi:ribbon-helix-helix domain-containing protein [Porticoccus sp. GXU_MW_L64]
MASSMNLSLTDELREFVDSRTGDANLYATPSEYLRDLIRRDMQSQSTLVHVVKGLDDLAHGRLSDKSILDVAEED